MVFGGFLLTFVLFLCCPTAHRTEHVFLEAHLRIPGLSSSQLVPYPLYWDHHCPHSAVMSNYLLLCSSETPQNEPFLVLGLLNHPNNIKLFHFISSEFLLWPHFVSLEIRIIIPPKSDVLTQKLFLERQNMRSTRSEKHENAMTSEPSYFIY